MTLCADFFLARTSCQAARLQEVTASAQEIVQQTQAGRFPILVFVLAKLSYPAAGYSHIFNGRI